MATIITFTGARHALLVDGTNDYDTEIIYQYSNGTPIDLTGMTFSWTFSVRGTTLTATSGSGLTITPLQGKITLHFSAVQMGTLPLGLGKHKLMVTAPTVKTLMKGDLVCDT